MNCKRAYTVSGQIQHGSDQEKYVQVSAQQQSDMWKNPRGPEKKQSQSKLKITLCLTVDGSNSVAPSTLLGFIHELKMNSLGLSAIVTCLWCAMYTLLGRGGDT